MWNQRLAWVYSPIRQADSLFDQERDTINYLYDYIDNLDDSEIDGIPR